MAYWKETGYMGGTVCSNCGVDIDAEYYYMFRNIPEGISPYDFCPCCGSRMSDMEENNDDTDSD